MMAWRRRTQTGRVVYDRPKHPFDIYRVARIATSLFNASKFTANDYAPWSSLLRLSELATTYVLRKQYVRETLGPRNQTYAAVAKLHWWLAMAVGVADPVLSRLPVVKQVWDAGKPLLDWCVETLGQIVGRYTYDPKTDVVKLL